MRTLSRRRFGLGLAAGAGLGVIGAPRVARARWYPRQPIEFVIMAGEGGGADRLARFITNIIADNRLADQPIIPINKGADSGGEALSYMKANAGNPHIIMATLNSLYTTPLRVPSLGIDIAHLTPIARLAEDTFVLWVNAETGITNINEYVAAVRAAGPQYWKMGGTGTGQEDSLVTAMLEEAYGIKHTYVPFKGGGTVAKNLISGDVNSTVNNPSEQIDFYNEGLSRPIAAFTPRRLRAFPHVPTFRELGHNLVYFMQRSVVAPGRISEEARIFYEDIFKKVHLSVEWKDYTEKKALNRAWLKRDPLMDYLLSEREVHRGILSAMREI